VYDTDIPNVYVAEARYAPAVLTVSHTQTYTWVLKFEFF